jgi:5'-3' exonuclease
MDQISPNEKNKLYSLFANVKDKLKESDGLGKTQDSDILIADGMNTFCRAFSAIPTLNDDGMHTGGVSGFLKSLGYAIRLLNPTRCVVVFDGQGGSVRRKKIFPDYKQHRANKIRLNRIFEDSSTAESESQAMARQLIRVSHYIDTLPVTTIQMDNVEADDVMAYLALDSFKNSNVTIMSADKDFYQIVDDRVKLYSPTKKKIYGPHEVYSEFGIHTKNFVLFRILDGDKSDNIDGITGCGLKTIIKAFPFLTDNNLHTVQEIFDYAELNKGKLKVYQTILDNKNVVLRNYDLMQLNETIIATFAQLNIGDILKKKNKLNRYTFNNMITEDKLWNAIPNHGVWLNETFSKLDNFVIL